MKKNIFKKSIVVLIVSLILIISTNDSAQAQSPELLTIPNPTLGAFDAFGWGASIDGNMVVIGAPNSDFGATNSGSAYLFDTSGNLLQTFNNPAPGIGDQFGISVLISDNKVIIGAYRDDIGVFTDAGSAYLFDTSGNLLQTFNNPAPEVVSLFGRSVSISNDKVLIGAPFHDAGAPDSGIAYLFDTSGNLLQTFNNPTPGIGDLFGHLVSISGNNVLIGADGDDTGNLFAGSVYLFDATTGNLLKTINNPDPDFADRFGTSVNISGNHILIGAPFDDAGAPDSGIAYLFDTSGNLLQTFNNPTPGIGELFGYQGSISGNNVILSAINDNTGASNTGIAYLFDIATGNLLRIYSNPTPDANDQFGTIVATSNNQVLIGAPWDMTGGPRHGSAYLIFEPTTDTDVDKIPDVLDNCPNVYNQDQADIDDDRIGDVCDPLHLISKDTEINTIFVVQTGQTMQILPDTILKNFDIIIIAGTLNNAGTISNQADTRLINIGTGLINNNGGTITNHGVSVILNDGGGIIENNPGGKIINSGILINVGNSIIENNSGDGIIHSGILINIGNSIINNNGLGKIIINNGGLILNEASLINNNVGGEIVSNVGSHIINRGAGSTINNNLGSDITNYGTIINTGTGANIFNSGTITNNFDSLFINDDASTITNNQVITNNGGTNVNANGGTIENNSGAFIENINGGFSLNGAGSTITNNAGATIDIIAGIWYNDCGGIVNNLGTILGTIINLACV